MQPGTVYESYSSVQSLEYKKNIFKYSKFPSQEKKPTLYRKLSSWFHPLSNIFTKATEGKEEQLINVFTYKRHRTSYSFTEIGQKHVSKEWVCMNENS